jgi:hypothetical protein
MRWSGRVALSILLLGGCGPLWAQASAPVAPAREAPLEDIRDIRAPKSSLALTQSPLWPMAVGALLLTAAGYGVWRWRQRQVRGPALEPFELALQQLDEARRSMQPAAGREFGGRVSDIVRRYIELQFRVTVTQRTTQEFLQDLLSSSSTPLAQQQPLLAEFLQQSDLIKFTGDSLTLPTLEALLQSARHLVRETAHAATQHASIPAT